jgi:hypothetical protein
MENNNREWIYIGLFISLFIFIYLIFDKISKLNNNILVLQGRTENIPFQPTPVFNYSTPKQEETNYFVKKEQEIITVDPKGNAKVTTKTKAKETPENE